MHLKQINLKGFKSFPDRTTLAFGPGVSVVVGPNGSGKSNVTDAVLWAMGEQSPLAVRGQSMQDVIFGGGRGRQAGQTAEVELVLDNSDGGLALDFAEVSIIRRLDRAGEGEYRLNGARCRLVDVLEVLSDTGLGKESHSVISQGRVEHIVTSKPRDRRLLIEEAAGLGKHRKRRRRAQLKLQRTQDNLDRALDVEREARSRLRPLKRQAEAAELHERIERQSLEARWTLARDDVRARRAALAEAEAAAAAARAERDALGAELAGVAARREQAEEALARRSEQRDELARRAFAARRAADRIGMQGEAVHGAEARIRERLARRRAELAELEAAAAVDGPDEDGVARIKALEEELAAVERDAAAALERELAELEERRAAAEIEVARIDEEVAARVSALRAAESAADAARVARRDADRGVEAARREAARVGGELAAANAFLRAHAGAPGGARALADELSVAPGLELALSAALGGRLRAALVPDLESGTQLLDRAGRDGGSALVSGAPSAGGAPPAGGPAPAPGATPLLDQVSGPANVLALAAPLLAGVFVVDDLASLPATFTGTAVTRSGRVWFGSRRELRQVPSGGADRVLAERNRREALIADSEKAAAAEVAAQSGVKTAAEAVTEADAQREAAEQQRRAAVRGRDEAAEAARRAAWTIEQRRRAPDEGPTAVRRAQLQAELAAERRMAERAEAERRRREQRRATLKAGVAHDEQLVPAAEQLSTALSHAAEAVTVQHEQFDAALQADRAAGETVAQELRACAQKEAELQERLRKAGDALTNAEVRAQQQRDQEHEASHELEHLAEKLGLEARPAEEALEAEERDSLTSRVERLARRREQLGPVNPLAQDEYAEALAHVEELERQRTDLETAMRELKALIRDTDREIRETFEATFEAAAKNFEELVAQLFPGGRGRLRLVREDSGPRPVLGGQELPKDQDPNAAADAAAEAEADAEDAEEQGEEDLLGVEIEVTPAGKSTKRLSLLSGGEKSMTALGFLFAVFLARPCPFYILDEVEAALDDLNIDRFLTLLRRYADRAQFIVVTHQKRTMEAADVLYGVSMGDDGVSKVVSRRLPQDADRAGTAASAA